MYPVLAVSVGCPCGIGPEVSLLAALQAGREGLRCLLVGDVGAVRRAAVLRGLAPALVVPVHDPAQPRLPADQCLVWNPGEALSDEHMPWGRPTAQAGAAQLSWIDAATDLTTSRICDAIVTGPVSKEAIARSGAPGADGFVGHTEHIARRVGTTEPVMVFVAPEMAVALVTTHLALRDVPDAITQEAVHQATTQCARILSRLGCRPARIAIAALNPHAGEGGLFGHEEATVIAPAIEHARQSLAHDGVAAELTGPVGAETAFRLAMDKKFDAVVAMYHDQGTIPMKLAAFGRAVNVTAGMPIIRTSVDHGTGYDIAGKGQADPSSMLQAMRLAARLIGPGR